VVFCRRFRKEIALLMNDETFFVYASATFFINVASSIFLARNSFGALRIALRGASFRNPYRRLSVDGESHF